MRLINFIKKAGLMAYRTYGKKHVKYAKLNVREIFAQQMDTEGFNRYDIIVRYLAVENYYGKNDYGFSLYQKMQRARDRQNQISHKENYYIEEFQKLINSWEKDGYNENSAIILDSELQLIDGSHRVAMALYHGQEELSCMIYGNKQKTEYGLLWFIEKGFSIEEIENIRNKYKEISRDKKISVSVILWPPVSQYFDEITEKIKLLAEVSEVRDYNFCDEIFKKTVQGIYHIDDIADWKINKKIEYMRQYYPKQIRVIQLVLKQNHYRLKSLNNTPILIEGERLKKIIRNCYKPVITPYFYDIIIHTSDNYKQKNYLEELLRQRLSIKELFDNIAYKNWVLIKEETDYLPENFPETYAFSKDTDILCFEEDFDNICNTTLNQVEDLAIYYEIKVKKEEGRCKVRLELNGFLIHQIDISYRMEGMEENDVREMIRNRVVKKNYYIPRIGDEFSIRIIEYINNPQKEWHFTYLEKYLDKVNAAECIKKLNESYRQKAYEILSEIKEKDG